MDDDWRKPLATVLWLLAILLGVYVMAEVLMFLLGLALVGRALH